VEFIKANIKLDGVVESLHRRQQEVVEICTIYAQKGMFNIFLTIFFGTLAFALRSRSSYRLPHSHRALRAFPGALYGECRRRVGQCKKIVEVELKMKGTPLHDATVVGDTVGDPFKDTSSVAMNPVISSPRSSACCGRACGEDVHSEPAYRSRHSVRHFRLLCPPLLLRHADQRQRGPRRPCGAAKRGGKVDLTPTPLRAGEGAIQIGPGAFAPGPKFCSD